MNTINTAIKDLNYIGLANRASLVLQKPVTHTGSGEYDVDGQIYSHSRLVELITALQAEPGVDPMKSTVSPSNPKPCTIDLVRDMLRTTEVVSKKTLTEAFAIEYFKNISGHLLTLLEQGEVSVVQLLVAGRQVVVYVWNDQ